MNVTGCKQAFSFCTDSTPDKFVMSMFCPILLVARVLGRLSHTGPHTVIAWKQSLVIWAAFFSRYLLLYVSRCMWKETVWFCCLTHACQRASLHVLCVIMGKACKSPRTFRGSPGNELTTRPQSLWIFLSLSHTCTPLLSLPHFPSELSVKSLSIYLCAFN